MAAPGWPDWLSHLWYRTHYAAIFAGMTTAMSFRFAGGRHMPRAAQLFSWPIIRVSSIRPS